MSKKLDDLDMEVIREMAKSSQKVQDLIYEKHKVIYDIERAQNITFKKLEPVPRPNREANITKRHSKQTMPNEVRDKIIEETKKDYNSKIKEALIEKAFEQDREYAHPMVDDMDKENLVALIENGKEAYEERVQGNNKTLEERLGLDLDTINEKHNDYPIYFDFEKNITDVDKTPSPSDDFE